MRVNRGARLTDLAGMSKEDKAADAPENLENRRSAGRIQCDDLAVGQGTILDMSATGMRMRARPNAHEFTAGSTHLLTITGCGEPIVVAGTIVWIRKVHRAVEIGVEFRDVSPETKRQLFMAASGTRSLSCDFAEAA